MPSRRRASRSWGTRVVGVDVDPHKLEPLERGVEPDRRARARRAGRVGRRVGPTPRVIRPRGVGRDADVVLVSVGTPARSDGTVDLGFVERVTEELGAGRREPLVVPRDRLSQHRPSRNGRRPPAPDPRTSRRVGEADDAFGVGMVPEFLREGSGVDDFFAPPFTVAGVQGRPHARARDADVRRDRAAGPRGFDRGGRSRSSTRATRITRSRSRSRTRSGASSRRSTSTRGT